MSDPHDKNLHVALEKGPSRGNWANKTEFLLSALGYAIGIGNVWRFPYLCYKNGGGAFLIPYLLMLFFCGIPLVLMEMSLGQFTNRGCVSIFDICPLLKGTGYAIVIINILCTSYFCMLLAYPLAFLWNCVGGKLPWTGCDNSWNTEYCLSVTDYHRINQSLLQEGVKYATPADEFFHNKILNISTDINEIGSIVWELFFCNLVSWIVVFFCIMKSVKSIGKVTYFTATFPFVIIFILLIRGLTLPGAWEGIKFYIYPEWNQLLDLKVWAAAAMQIFFSLGPGWGGVVNMASYNKFRNNYRRDAIVVPIINCGTSIVAGFVVFSVLGYLSHKTGVPVSSVAAGGPSLAFVTYPEAIAMMPFPLLWAVLFFVMLFLLGIDTCFVQLESIISSVMDEYPPLRKSKVLVTLSACCALFLCSLLYVTNGGMYYLHLMDWYSGTFTVILICIIEVVMVAWIYGTRKFIRDVEFMTDTFVHWWWPLCWRYITPTILTFIFITAIAFNAEISYRGDPYPEWAVNLGWASCLVSMLFIPLYAGYKLLYFAEGDLFERIKYSCKAEKSWGPQEADIKREWMMLVYEKYKDRPQDDDPVHQQFIELVTAPVQ